MKFRGFKRLLYEFMIIQDHSFNCPKNLPLNQHQAFTDLSGRPSFSETRDRLSFRRLSISSPKPDTALYATSESPSYSALDPPSVQGTLAAPAVAPSSSIALTPSAGQQKALAGGDAEDKKFDLDAAELRVLEGGNHVCRCKVFQRRGGGAVVTRALCTV